MWREWAQTEVWTLILACVSCALVDFFFSFVQTDKLTLVQDFWCTPPLAKGYKYMNFRGDKMKAKERICTYESIHPFFSCLFFKLKTGCGCRYVYFVSLQSGWQMVFIVSVRDSLETVSVARCPGCVGFCTDVSSCFFLTLELNKSWMEGWSALGEGGILQKSTVI